jgi:hypothetical protein
MVSYYSKANFVGQGRKLPCFTHDHDSSTLDSLEYLGYGDVSQYLALVSIMQTYVDLIVSSA